MKKPLIAACGLGVLLFVSGFTWTYFGQREPVKFFAGHTHGEDGITEGAPQHSGGLERWAATTGPCPTTAIKASAVP